MAQWPLRSLLFVPAHRRDWVQKAINTGTDAVILDLEDSVPADHKATARALLAEEIAQLATAGVGALVRLNPAGAMLGDDVAAAVAPGVTAVMLPKADTAAEVARLHDLLSYHEGRVGLEHGSVGILALPETAEGLQRAEALVRASSRVKGIVSSLTGPVSGDIARAFGFVASRGGLEQLYMASKMVLDSRAGGAPYPVAGVFGLPFDDHEGIEALVRRARELGFTGCPVMHPSHVAIVNRVFAPTRDEAMYFIGLLAAYEQAVAAGKGAVSYQGAMVDLAMVPLAHETIAEYRRRNPGDSLEN